MLVESYQRFGGHRCLYFVFGRLFDDGFCIWTIYIASHDKITDVTQLEVTWKEMAMALSKYYPGIYCKGLR
jgi:hypothetical protein